MWRFCTVVALALPVAALAASLSRPFFKVTFDRWPTTMGSGTGIPYTREMAASDFGAMSKIKGHLRAWVQNVDEDGDGDVDPDERSLQVLFPKNQAGPDETGIFFVIPLNASRGYVLEYKIKFDGEDFDFVKGGVLPGLGNGLDDGLVANFIWKEDGQLCVNYSQSGDSADSIVETGHKVQPNEWMNLKLAVKIVECKDDQDENTNPDETKYVGVLNAWIDDESVFSKDDLPITGPKHQIDEFYFFAFYNDDGTDDSKADKDQYVYFSQLLVQPSD